MRILRKTFSKNEDKKTKLKTAAIAGTGTGISLGIGKVVESDKTSSVARKHNPIIQDLRGEYESTRSRLRNQADVQKTRIAVDKGIAKHEKANLSKVIDKNLEKAERDAHKVFIKKSEPVYKSWQKGYDKAAKSGRIATGVGLGLTAAAAGGYYLHKKNKSNK